MSIARQKQRTRTAILDNPLDGEQLLLDAMYGPRDGVAPGPRTLARTEPAPARRRAPKPEHYKVVSISLYTEDIERLDRIVRELKRRGYYKANKSQVIRHALAQLDLDAVPRER